MTTITPREQVSHLFTVGLFLGFLALLFYLFSPYVGSLVGAIALGVSFYPMHLWIGRHLKFFSVSFHAIISDLVVMLLIVIPLFLMIWAAMEQSDTWGPVLNDWQNKISQLKDGQIVESSSMKHLRGWLTNTFSIQPSQFREQVMKSANRILGFLASLGTKVAGTLIASMGNMVLLVFALFFVFRDGPLFYSQFESFLPLREEQKKECKERGHLMVTGVIRGWLLGAVLQGAVAAIGYFFAGIKGWMFFGVLTMLTGLIPLIGTSLIWVPLSINSLIQGEVVKGLFLFGWGVLVISLIDNVLRPYLVGKNSDVPFFYLFFSLLGGIQVWGIKGIIIGPVLVGIAPVIFDIYKKRYLNSSSHVIK